MANVSENILKEVAAQFGCQSEAPDIRIYGNGHINDTFLVQPGEGEEGEAFILQRISSVVFPEPVKLMENIISVTRFLQKEVERAGGDPKREALNLIPASDGQLYYVDSEGSFWRAYIFISEGCCYDRVEKVEHFYESAVTFGNFQRLLAAYPAETLHETIPDFHNTKARLAAFKKAVAEDVKGRAASVREEIQFVLDREDVADYFSELQASGAVPLRVTHNDTKLNNIMIDPATGKGLCVLDLDTVMPGLVMNDFGDAIRFGASTAAEDEKDLSKVSCDLNLYEIYLKGFLKGCGESLTSEEIRQLPMGAKVMTYECGMRFLMDYLQGDIYFKIHRPEHNLDRCRTQFKLVQDMENKWEEMQRITAQYLK